MSEAQILAKLEDILWDYPVAISAYRGKVCSAKERSIKQILTLIKKVLSHPQGTMSKKTEWEKEFNKRFTLGGITGVVCLKTDNAMEIKSFISDLLAKEKMELVKAVRERMELEKHRAEIAKTEVEYKKGKYIGLRYAVDIVSAFKSEIQEEVG